MYQFSRPIVLLKDLIFEDGYLNYDSRCLKLIIKKLIPNLGLVFFVDLHIPPLSPNCLLYGVSC